MGINVRRPRGLFGGKASDYLFVKNVFDGVHQVHLKLTERMSLDVYRNSVTNITASKYKLSVLVQGFPPLLKLAKLVTGEKQEPFYLRIAEKDDRPVGALYGIESAQSPGTVILDNVGVAGGRLDTGIRLVGNFMNWASAQGYETVRADILCNNLWSSRIASTLEAEPARIILARNIEPRTGASEEGLNEATHFEHGLLSASIKHQSSRSWYKHSTLKLSFGDAAGPYDEGALLKAVQEAADFGARNGCGLVETEISISNTWMREVLQNHASFKAFKYVYEQQLIP